VTKRVAAALALLLCLVGCDVAPAPDGEAVLILTGPPNYRYDHGGCFTNSARGQLFVDPTYGTAIVDEDMIAVTGTRPPPVPVAWRPGFTARRLGTEVEVLDPNGRVVAITGRSYLIPGGYVNAGGSSGLNWPDLPVGVFWACGALG
jgi:hypothetical protein